MGDTTYTLDNTVDLEYNGTMNVTATLSDSYSLLTGAAEATSMDQSLVLAETFDITPLITKINMSIEYIGGNIVAEGIEAEAVITIETPLADEEWNTSALIRSIFPPIFSKISNYNQYLQRALER